MASYGSVTEIRQYLSQVPSGAANDALLQDCLDRATAMIDGELGFAFAAFGATAASKDFCSRVASQYLELPAYQAGSITSVYELSAKGTTYESTDEVLATEYDILDDVIRPRLYRYEGWPAGWYRVTAIWGYGPAPAEIVQVCLEKAVNLYLGAQGGQFSDVVGIEGGGAVGYNRAWTNAQRRVMENMRARFGEYGFA